MRLVITGATGFIGKRVVAALSKQHELVCLARDPAPIAELGLEAIACDLTELDTRALPQRIDGVLHIAQSLRYREFPEGAADAFAVNVHATSKLLDYAVSARADRFCLISSGSVYEPYQCGLREDAPLAPTSLNGTTKLAGELIARAYSGAMRTSFLRLFFPYGPQQKSRLIPDLIARIQQGRAVTVAAGVGMTLRPTYVDDIAALIARAVIEAWEGPVNVASEENVSVREAANCIGNELGLTVKFEEGPGGLTSVIPDTTLLTRLAPDFAFTPFERGVRFVLAGDEAI